MNGSIGHNFPPPENPADEGAPCMILQRATGEITIKGPSYLRVVAEMKKYPAHTLGNVIEETPSRWSVSGKRGVA